MIARRLGALTAGVVASLAFAPLGWWGSAILGVALGVLVIRRDHTLRGAYLDGFLIGIGFFLPLLVWVRPPGDDAWIALSVYQALIFAVVGPLTALLVRLPMWPLFAGTAWVAEEAIRSRIPFGGFPWGRLAFSQDGAPTLHWASWAGAPGVSFITATAGTLLAGAAISIGRLLLAPPGDRSSRVTALRAATAFAIGAAAALTSGRVIATEPHAGPRIEVAVVQGNVPRLGLSAFQQRAAVLSNHLGQTYRLAGEVAAGTIAQPELVIWPENASDIDPFLNPRAGAAIRAAARTVRAPILVGAVLDGRTDAAGNLVTVRNTGVVFNPDGTVGEPYVKRHPVPFGEYIPFRSELASSIRRLSLIPYDFEKGTKPGVLPMGPTVIGDVICFEVAYDGIVRDAVNGGGRLIVVQTNNATFGRSSESRQQLAMGRLRAVEHQRTTLVAATSGISAIIEPDGRVARQSRIFTADLLTASVPLLATRTLADQVGDAPEWALTVLCFALCAVAVVLTRFRRSAT